jgi:hypothetical protein
MEKWHWVCFLSVLRFPLPILIPLTATYSSIIRAFTIGPTVVWVPSRLSLTPPWEFRINRLLFSVSGKLLLALDSTIVLGCESRGTHDHILLSRLHIIWLRNGPQRKHRAQQFFYCCLLVAAGTYLPSRCLARRLFRLHYSGFQALGGNTDTQAQGDLLSPLLFFQNKENRLKGMFKWKRHWLQCF